MSGGTSSQRTRRTYGSQKKYRKCDIKGHCPGHGLFRQYGFTGALPIKPDISEETKKVIREKASEMGYIANALASFARSGVSRNIRHYCGRHIQPHFSVMVKEMQTLLQRKGYNSIIFNTDEKAAMERQAITTSLSQNVDGIILCPAPGGERNIRFLQMHDKPFVMIGKTFQRAGCQLRGL